MVKDVNTRMLQMIAKPPTFPAAASLLSLSIHFKLFKDFLKAEMMSIHTIQQETARSYESKDKPVITFVPFVLESPPKVFCTKYLPAAKPIAASTFPTQNSARSPTAPGLMPLRRSSNDRTASHASVSMPKLAARERAARVSR